MAQPQHQAPPRAFSPAQHSPSPAASQSAFALPPNKRPRTDGASSQPDSPYAGSPYAASPVAVGTPPATAPSPSYSQSSNPPGAYAPPYTNGHSTPGLSLPNAQAAGNSPLQTPQLPQQPQYTSATMAPLPNTPAQAAGVMGPPQRPADRTTKDYQYDPMDSLAGTGIDLSAEEKYMSELYANAFDSNTEARTGFAQHPAGSKSSFYGAGPANQGAEAPSESEQDKFAREAAEKAWSDSAVRLAMQRTQEIKDPFLLVAMLHRKADKIAREHSIGLNLEYKNNTASMGKMRLPDQFPAPKVTVSTKPGPESSAMVQTTGSFLPHDAFLVDQLALLSIASKHRMRELLEDASVIASTRQKTSHGEVPEDWSEAAAPLNRDPVGESPNGDVAVPDSAISPGTNPLKRSANGVMPNGTSAAKLPKITSFMTSTMREQAKKEREWEEARLRRRQKRKDGITDERPSASRANSVAPATPGSVAPEPEKAMTKKELKKNQAAKAAEAHSHANQNMTSSMFAGLGGRSGLFGKKKGGKSYDWMNVGRGGSGTATPTKATPGGGKGLGGVPGSPAAANMALTTEGRNRLGTWREDKEKGKKIQLRDWVTVLERDGRESRALQRAYLALDLSDPR